MEVDKVKKALKLLNQIIEKSSIDDRVESLENPNIATDGDGWVTHHLKLLKEILKEAKDA
tara:strand:- start:1034 stop:1213 length:180 start_codon:yes stop_codon:yes gene_type:complete